MTRDLKEALEEWTAYWREHHQDSAGVEQRLKYIEDHIVPGFFHVMFLALREIENLQGKPRSELGRRLWLPVGLEVKGDVRRLG